MANIEFTPEEWARLTRAWGQCYLNLNQIGDIIRNKMKEDPTFSLSFLKDAKIEVAIVKRDKNGKVIHTQNIESKGDGTILKHEREDFPNQKE